MRRVYADAATSRFRLPPALLPDRGHAGYALLSVVFLAAVMIIALSAAVPDLLVQGRREREEEMIWRGEQYARGVKLFFRKNGRFPQKLEDLTEPQNNIRFMRKAYTDPMNREDGSWRLIYVAPNGQLIGSITRSGLIRFPQPPGQPQGSASGSAAGAGQRPTGEMPGVPQQQPTGVTPPQGPPEQAPQNLPDSSRPIIGGNIIGVASKIQKDSIKFYKGYGSYQQWEFIWNPAEDQIVVGTAPGPHGAGQPQPSKSPQPQGQPPKRQR
jgi:type II secretory pathway pseudopilin PulG